MLESLDPERLGNQVKAGLARQAERIEVAPLLGSALTAAIADGRHRPLLDALIRWAGMTLEKNEELVRAMIQARANALLRWTGLDEKLANSVLDGLYRMLAEVLVDPDHQLRKTVEEGLAKLAHDLAHDPETREKVEAAKREMLANPAVGDWWTGVWEKLRAVADRHGAQSRRGAVGPARRSAWPSSAGRCRRIRRCSGRSTASPAAPRSAWPRATARRSSSWCPRRCGAGTRRRSPTGSRTRSGATCSSSASTARWSAGWSGW